VSLFPSGNEGFNLALENTPLQHHPALALETLDTDVGTQPGYLPFIAAAGVFLLQADDITQSYLHNHDFSLANRILL
jgi:hypothetical protein